MNSDQQMDRPECAELTEKVDMYRGAIRVSGHLGAPGGSALVRTTVDALHSTGHGTIVLDLQDVGTLDDAGLEVVRDIRRSLAATGGRLFVIAPSEDLAS